MRKGEFKTALPGERFGRLMVLSAKGKSRNCRCDCGNEVSIDNACKLKSGNTRSCGCLRRELTGKTSRKHGASKTLIYAVWSTMIQRCTNPNNKKFYRYGGRGIMICQRWRESFQAFLQDMGEPPAGHSLDRINNDGNYEPGNCRWAPTETQARNRSNNRLLMFKGKTQTIIEWAKELGIARNTIQTRLRLGWKIERVLNAEISNVL